MSELFEKAARIKLRFPTSVGFVTAENLWDMPLTSNRYANLDETAQALHRAVKDAEETSFVVKTHKPNEELQLQFDIVKYIIDVKLAEDEVAKTAVENRAKKQRLLEVLSQKQDQELSGKSTEEIEAMIAAL